MPADKLSRNALAAMIDHAMLRPEATRADLRQACLLAARRKVGCLCVRPCDVAEAYDLLRDSGVTLGTAVGFPHGAALTAVKAAEAAHAVAEGAREIDMVLNIARLRDGEVGCVREEIAAVVAAAAGHVVKVILECCYLDRDQMAAGCRAALDAGARFVKTSTGFGPGGATVEDVAFLRSQVGRRAGVKAAGGIGTLTDARAMIDAGADRIGTSRTAQILDELPD